MGGSTVHNHCHGGVGVQLNSSWWGGGVQVNSSISTGGEGRRGQQFILWEGDGSAVHSSEGIWVNSSWSKGKVQAQDRVTPLPPPPELNQTHN